MKKNKILLGLLGLSIVFMSNPATSQENKNAALGGILFKIHDVIPEKNNDGDVVNCNISLTIYNQTNQNLSNIQFDLIWEDEVIADTILREENAIQNMENNSITTDKMRYTTAKTTTPKISTNIKLPLINAFQQISLKNKVNTDHCFLLINDMDIKLKSCSVVENASSIRECKTAFRYITPHDPAYYSEFKEISYEDDIQNLKNELEKVKDENKSTYNNIISTLKSIGK